MLKKTAAIMLTAGALVLCAPAVASADSYAKPPNVTVGDPVIDVCEVSTIAFGAGYFEPGENVGVGVSGQNGDAASYSGNVANADGGLVLSFRPPADGTGTYAVSFNGSRSYTATITVSQGHDAAVSCDHDPSVAAPANTEMPLSGDGFELALTGGGVSPWVLGGGAAALIAGGALVAAGAASRRTRA